MLAEFVSTEPSLSLHPSLCTLQTTAPAHCPPPNCCSAMRLVSDASRRHFQIREPNHYRGRQQRAIFPDIGASKHAHLPPLPEAELPVLSHKRGRISGAAVDRAAGEPAAVDVHSGAGPIVQWFKRGCCFYLCLPWSPGGHLCFVLFSRGASCLSLGSE